MQTNHLQRFTHIDEIRDLAQRGATMRDMRRATGLGRFAINHRLQLLGLTATRGRSGPSVFATASASVGHLADLMAEERYPATHRISNRSVPLRAPEIEWDRLPSRKKDDEIPYWVKRMPMTTFGHRLRHVDVTLPKLRFLAS